MDDEKHVRDGLLILAQWERYGITEIFEAEDVDQAIALITEHQPEIVFTDMRMPKKDGISLLKWIDTTGLDCKTIVVSGYDDFQYMRNAIFYKSFDYLLKPIDPDILNETLERAVTEWKENANRRKSQMEDNKVINEVKPLYVDNLFTKLISGTTPLSPEVIKKVSAKCHITMKNQGFTIGILPIQPFLKLQFREDQELIHFMIINICNEILHGNNRGIAFRNVERDDELVILIWEQQNTTALMERIHSSIYKASRVNCTIAIGEQARHIPEAYNSALHVFLTYSLIDQPKGMVNYENVVDKKLVHLLDYSEDIKWAIQSGNTANMDAILERIYNLYEQSHHLSWEQLRIWENQFVILRQHWLKEYQIHQQVRLYSGENLWDDHGHFSFDRFKAEKKKEFHDLINTLYHAKYQKEKNTIQQIEEYIRNNYQKDLNLRDISAMFYLSREHISRRFRQEYNETITDYVTKIRMEKAKELLENPHLKIYEIANKVGYQNEGYFSRLFKKMMGYTPNEYRSLL